MTFSTVKCGQEPSIARLCALVQRWLCAIYLKLAFFFLFFFHAVGFIPVIVVTAILITTYYPVMFLTLVPLYNDLRGLFCFRVFCAHWRALSPQPSV